MARLSLSDVFIPEIWNKYSVNMVQEKSELIANGVAIGDPVLDSLITQGGDKIKLPMWMGLTGDDEVLTENNDITLGTIGAGLEIAPVLIRAKGWGAHELAGIMSGDDPMRVVLDKYASWCARQEQNIVISIMKGLLNNTGALKEHLLDISAGTGEAAKITAAAVLDAKQTLYDGAKALTAIAMHSAVYTSLQKAQLIEYMPVPSTDTIAPTYLGYKIIIDDNVCTGTNGIYTTYLFGEGAFARGEGFPITLTSIEVARNAAGSEDQIYTRRAIVMHPRGLKFIAASHLTATDPTPSNSDLALKSNWELVANHKNIALAALCHKI